MQLNKAVQLTFARDSVNKQQAVWKI